MSQQRPLLKIGPSILATLCGLALLNPAWGASAKPSGDSSASIGAEIHGLESSRYAEREATSKRLLKAEGKSVPALLAVARTGSLEAAVRAVGLLEAIYIAADAKGELADFAADFATSEEHLVELLLVECEADETLDAAETALDELGREGPPSVADRADFALEVHTDIRERRALAEIERLNGVPHFDNPSDTGPLPPVRNGNLRPEPPPGPGAAHQELTMVVIGPKWKGGDEGLKHVARLKRLRMVYRIEGSHVSNEAIARLQSVVPGLEVQVRGAAKLGIRQGPMMGWTERAGYPINTVEPGEAAARAGLQPRDVILRFDGKRVDDFETLIRLLRAHKPGDVIETYILRDDTPMTVPVKLTGWD